MSNNSSPKIIIFEHEGDGDQLDRLASCINVLTLQHPRNGPTIYAELNGEIYDLQSVSPSRHRSWFINQKVSSDGSYMLASKTDCRFLLLPHFEKHGQKYSPVGKHLLSLTLLFI